MKNPIISSIIKIRKTSAEIATCREDDQKWSTTFESTHYNQEEIAAAVSNTYEPATQSTPKY